MRALWAILMLVACSRAAQKTDAMPPATSPPPVAQTGPGQGQPCDKGNCGQGLMCVEFYGVAGPAGPKLSSCEIPCDKPGAQCPHGQKCVTIADGPGQVCRGTTAE
jgi:hypothetical protein